MAPKRKAWWANANGSASAAPAKRCRLTKKAAETAPPPPPPTQEDEFGDPGLKCNLCFQMFGEVDKHDRFRGKIIWGAYNRMASGRRKATTNECQPCRSWRRAKMKTAKGKVKSNADVSVEMLADDHGPNPHLREEMMKARAEYMNSGGWTAMDECSRRKNTVSRTDGEFSREYGAGHFYYLRDDCALLNSEIGFSG